MSIKISRKKGWSSIPSKSVQVLWWTLIKVFFDRLHYQSLRQKLWPSFLVQENFESANYNVSKFSWSKSFNFIFPGAIFYVLQFSDTTYKTLYENTSEKILLIFCYAINILFRILLLLTLEIEKIYLTLPEYIILIADSRQSPSKFQEK